MSPELLMCIAILAHPVSGSPQYYTAADITAELERKCEVGCFVITSEELIGGLRSAHRAGRLTVVDEERRKGYSEGLALGLRAAAARKPAAERSAP